MWRKMSGPMAPGKRKVEVPPDGARGGGVEWVPDSGPVFCLLHIMDVYVHK